MSLRLFGFGLQREITFLGSYLGTLYTLRCFYHIAFRCQVAVAFEHQIVRCDLKGNGRRSCIMSLYVSFSLPLDSLTRRERSFSRTNNTQTYGSRIDHFIAILRGVDGAAPPNNLGTFPYTNNLHVIPCLSLSSQAAYESVSGQTHTS